MRIRSPKSAILMLNQLDPENRFTLYALRQLLKRGEIKVIHAGPNHLLDFDELLKYLQNPPIPEADTQKDSKIRRIDVNQKR